MKTAFVANMPVATLDVKELLGDEGYAALRGCKTITKAQMRQVIEIMVKHALGDEDPKAP